MAAEIQRRLKPGAPLVVAHLSVANAAAGYGEGGAGERDLWLSRYVAFQVASGVPPEHAAKARNKVAAELAVLTRGRMRRFCGWLATARCGWLYGIAFRGWVA